MGIGMIVKIRDHAYRIKPGKGKYGKYERLKLAIWWNHNDFDANGNPTHLYHMNDSIAERETFRQGLEAFKELPVTPIETKQAPLALKSKQAKK